MCRHVTYRADRVLFFTYYVMILINPYVFYLGDGLGEGYGMLGQAGSGKLRVSAGQSKLAAKVAKRYVIPFAFLEFLLLFHGIAYFRVLVSS